MSSFVVVDTNILILSSQGRFDLSKLYDTYEEVLVSVVSQVEALGFNFPTELEASTMAQYFDDLVLKPFTDAEAQHAIFYRKASRIKFPDAAILATARAAGADLLTENLADFRGRDAAVRVLNVGDL